MTIPTFDDTRQRLSKVWGMDGYEEEVLWAGIFGSVGRNRAREESDVDILIVMKAGRSGEPMDLREELQKACGREISVMFIWQGEDWAWGHVRLEALLSSRTVYGDRQEVEPLRLMAMQFLLNGINTLDQVGSTMKGITDIVDANSYESFMDNAQQYSQQEFIRQLRKIVKLLDIQPLHHLMRTLIYPQTFGAVDLVRDLLTPSEDGLQGVGITITALRTLWDNFQPGSPVRWLFDDGCKAARRYIDHMIAAKKLADAFEENGRVDDSMYSMILR